MSTANDTTHGRLSMTEGVLSVSVGGNAYMDAAAVQSIAGIELSVEEARVTIGPRPDDRRADLTLCLDMHRHTMERLFYVLAKALDLPAFDERQWRMIAGALQAHAMTGTGEAFEMAKAILDAYDGEQR